MAAAGGDEVLGGAAADSTGAGDSAEGDEVAIALPADSVGGTDLDAVSEPRAWQAATRRTTTAAPARDGRRRTASWRLDARPVGLTVTMLS